MKTLDQLHDELTNYRYHDSEYEERMIHDLPEASVIERATFILKKCTDKVVLDVGCYGPLHRDIKLVAKKAYGIDVRVTENDPDVFRITLTKDPMPKLEDVEFVVCGEIVEHLSNPGLFLDELKEKYEGKEKVFTVPNAFGSFHSPWIKKGKENTNIEHVAYYTHVTMSTLLNRHGYKIKEFYWYDNPERVQQHGFNEGMVFVTT